MSPPYPNPPPQQQNHHHHHHRHHHLTNTTNTKTKTKTIAAAAAAAAATTANQQQQEQQHMKQSTSIRNTWCLSQSLKHGLDLPLLPNLETQGSSSGATAKGKPWHTALLESHNHGPLSMISRLLLGMVACCLGQLGFAGLC